jgi:putative nucleotidyltransferase with HDIG domain
MAFIFSLKEQPLLRKIYQFSKRLKTAQVYIVGGYLRDIFLRRNKDNPDIDFALPQGSIGFARRLSYALKAGFVILDKKRGCARVIKKAKGKIYTLDFADFRGKSLKEDLARRDFTINALALSLNVFATERISPDSFIDYYGGLCDLKSGWIKALSPQVFDEDPLRLLRAFSFSSIFNFKIEPATQRLIKIKKDKIVLSSFERIRDELFKILDNRYAGRYLEQLDTFGLLNKIIPEIDLMKKVKQGPYHHLDVWRHSLETLRQLELLLGHIRNADIRSYLEEVICSGRRRLSLIKLAALLHDIGKPQTRRRRGRRIKFYGHEKKGKEIATAIARRLKLSREEYSCLKKMIFFHLRPGYLADNKILTPRAIFRYFRDTDQEAVSTLLLSVADQRATKGPLTCDVSRTQHEKICFSLIKEYFRKSKERKLVALTNGHEIMRRFKLTPSPLIGKILDEIREAQSIGQIKTKKEAFEIARKII